ncbi:hypothetical protein GQ44DRAFT_778156 [Phaeosphaeriaceae sp. PMI808]|nr:hypothetical protein GQ44DRAFT_778156 [Phaeosphaeriaceae sp. PMI808]
MPKRFRSASNATAFNSGGEVEPPAAKRRACSTPPRSPPLPAGAEPERQMLPLTLDNLAKHTLAYEPAQQATISTTSLYTMTSRSGSPTRSAWDKRVLPRSYRIEVDVTRALPIDLQTHLDTILLRKREGPRSPNAKHIVEYRLTASLENEITGIRLMEPLLLFAGEGDPTANNRVPLLSTKLGLNLSRDLLPTPPLGKTLPRLTQPQPDTITGYLSILQDMETKLATAFTIDEEEALGNFTLNPVLMFPFLTSQWKPATGESYVIAHYQSARDGAAIIRYLDKFYEIAHGRPATTLECSHISVTCDIQVVNIWMHWRELDTAGEATYYMKSIYDCTLRNENHLLEARAILWNHIEYALEGRLQSLKEAIGLFSLPNPKAKTTKSVGSGSIHPALVSFPPTPSSEYPELEPVKKTQRTEYDGE